MKIEIDTKHDSPEEIKKVIKMLQHLVGEHAYTNQPNIFEDPSSFGTNSSESPSSEPSSDSGSTNAFVNMFGNASSAGEPKEEPMDEPKEETETEEASEEKEEIPDVITY